MIELFSANTPNGKKISIMLEEIGYDYKVNKVDINTSSYPEGVYLFSINNKNAVLTKRMLVKN